MADNSTSTGGEQSGIAGLLTLLMEAGYSNINPKSWLETFEQVDAAAHNTIATFGQGSEMVKAIKDTLTDSVVEVTKLGGSFEKIAAMQNDISGALNRNIILQSDSIEKLYAASEISGKNAGVVASNFKDAGYSVYQSSGELQKTVDIARGMGVNVKAVTGLVVDNIDKLNKYNFEGGVEGLSRMASQASMLRIDMKKTLDLADSLFDPAKAIDMAASLQRLGVQQSALLDPLKLMNLAQNNPEELQNQIVQMTKSFAKFNEETGKFEIPSGSRRQLMEISKSLGIGYEELTKMSLGSLELDTKLQKIRFPEFMNEDQRKMIANMAEMGDGGEYKIKIYDEKQGKVIEQSIDKLREEQLAQLKEQGTPKSMEQLLREQQPYTVQMANDIRSLANRTGYALAGTDIGENLYKKVTDGMNKMADDFQKVMNPKDFKDVLNKDIGAIGKELNDVMLGKQSVGDAFQKLKGPFGDMADNIIPKLKKGFGDWVDDLEKLGLINKKMIKTLLDNEKKLYTNTSGGGNRDSTVQNDFIYDQENDRVTSFSKGDLVMGVDKKSMEGNMNTPLTAYLGKQTDSISKTESNNTINLNINLSAPPNVDSDTITKHVIDLIRNNSTVGQTIVQTIKNTTTNYGQTVSYKR